MPADTYSGQRSSFGYSYPQTEAASVDDGIARKKDSAARATSLQSARSGGWDRPAGLGGSGVAGAGKQHFSAALPQDPGGTVIGAMRGRSGAGIRDERFGGLVDRRGGQKDTKTFVSCHGPVFACDRPGDIRL